MFCFLYVCLFVCFRSVHFFYYYIFFLTFIHFVCVCTACAVACLWRSEDNLEMFSVLRLGSEDWTPFIIMLGGRSLFLLSCHPGPLFVFWLFFPFHVLFLIWKWQRFRVLPKLFVFYGFFFFLPVRKETCLKSWQEEAKECVKSFIFRAGALLGKTYISLGHSVIVGSPRSSLYCDSLDMSLWYCIRGL